MMIADQGAKKEVKAICSIHLMVLEVKMNSKAKESP
jgi:hypothetical protein